MECPKCHGTGRVPNLPGEAWPPPPLQGRDHEFSAHSNRPWECRICRGSRSEHGRPRTRHATAPHRHSHGGH